MAIEQLKKSDNMTTKTIKSRKHVFFDTNSLSWLPWVMEGTWFKLLNVDMKTGGYSMLLKVDPDNYAPVHGHLGAVEGMILEGEFGYDDDRGGTMHYVWEPAGAVHQPDSPGGFTMFAVMHAPLMGYNDDGSIAAVVDGKMMYIMARDGGQADHLEVDYPELD
jgi:anti-sigma factor ChrR (cupin superfamily)